MRKRIRMILTYPPILIGELIKQKYSPRRVIGNTVLLYGGIGLMFYTSLGLIIYRCLK